MNVEGMIKKYLEDNGFEGLYDPRGECGCEIANLRACCEDPCDCLPGYKHGYKNDAWIIKPNKKEEGGSE